MLLVSSVKVGASNGLRLSELISLFLKQYPAPWHVELQCLGCPPGELFGHRYDCGTALYEKVLPRDDTLLRMLLVLCCESVDATATSKMKSILDLLLAIGL